MTLLINNELARKIEDIKLQGTREYVIERKRKSPLYKGEYFSLDDKGTVFLMDNYCFGVGFGINGEVLSSDIETLENYICRSGIQDRLYFEVTPFSNQSFITFLHERGYTLDHFLNVWILVLDDWVTNKNSLEDKNVEVIQVKDKESYEWARTVALGFSSDNNVTEEAVESVRGFMYLNNSKAFLLKENGKSVAGGFLAIRDQLGELFSTSTIESHRGKGYQNVLIEERIKFAKLKGCSHLTVTTNPTTASSRNMERQGFKLVYNKVVLKSPQLNK